MSYPVYYVEENDTLPVLFTTYGGTNGESITCTGLAVTDIEIYKDGSITQRASDAGYALIDTDGIDIDGVTGLHGFTLDLSDDTDAGFYAVGSWYHVVVSAITVDAQTVTFIACSFRVVSATRCLAGTALPNAAADAAGGLTISDAGGLDLDAQRADVAAVLVDTAEIGAAGAGLTGIPTAILDLANGVETGVTVRQLLRALGAVLAGEASGGPGVSAFKALANAGTTRVTITADTAGDRSSVVLNL